MLFGLIVFATYDEYVLHFAPNFKDFLIDFAGGGLLL